MTPPKIILIETSTSLCSVALAIGARVVESRESSAPRAHASLTALFIKEILDAQGLKVEDCDAVCVCAGPGSYTGLRVGVSTAKGLCFAASLPLLSVDTLEVLAQQADCDSYTTIVPMIDARRMEVYTACYSPNLERRTEIMSVVVDESSFASELAEGEVLFIGDGAQKCSTVIKSPRAHFCQINPHASAMIKPALREWEQRNFRDIAYFEPFYLKQFTATISKKKLF